ncbi:MAG: PEP/pyruvate-binding domain-containing protein [Gemmatimonadales bacterium]|jgi:pyruvate,water dikinase
MGADLPLVVPLANAASLGERQVGGKAAKLSGLMASGYRIPAGFCITTRAYRRFLADGGLKIRIDMETERKAMSSMRWEEIWDAALRIRTAFLRTPIPADVTREIIDAYHSLSAQALAVRSSAVGEDSVERSYAGLHESLVGVMGEEALLDAVRVVWASLWSDAALLYRQELELAATTSAMAVIVQQLVSMDRSGVGFGRDPRDPAQDRQIIEAVPGLCQDLVDGSVDPDRWLIRRSSGEILEWLPGQRAERPADRLLDDEDVDLIHRTLNQIETAFGWPPDVEWTGRKADFTLLQARPVTTAAPRDETDQREWYLSLRPGRSKLEALCKRVTEDLIPKLEREGRRLAAEAIEELTDGALADAIDQRAAAYARWKKTYWDEFIPFAHGVRQLGTYYNDAVKPDDPYEFVGILRDQPMIAAERNAALRQLAAYLTDRPPLQAALRDLRVGSSSLSGEAGSSLREAVADVDGGPEFMRELDSFCERYMDVVYEGDQLDTRPDVVLHTVIEMAEAGLSVSDGSTAAETATPADYENRLLDAVGPERHDEARSVIEIARLSWRLRDDDNVLLGRVEKQLLRAAQIGAERLERAGRLDSSARTSVESAPVLSAALRDNAGGPVLLPEAGDARRFTSPGVEGATPRQIVGQPAAPGLVTARARAVRTTDDFTHFHAGEVLICDAIQPTMSHIVPLAAGIVERRGGMLIHGAIIARELGIPCVNGVSDAILSIADDEIVTVDGYLGIVTIGPPEFDLETAPST